MATTVVDPDNVPRLVRWHFAWVGSDAVPFDPATMAREDEMVFELDISEDQGGFALATLTVQNPRVGLYGAGRKQWMWISSTVAWPNGTFSVEPWILGYLEAWPSDGSGDELKLSLKAQPADWFERQEAVLADARVAPWYDEAFVGSVDPVTQPEVNLEARPALVHCDRVTHEASLVSVIDAPDILDIGDQWEFESWRPSRDQQPLDVVRTITTVRWRQPVKVSFTLGPVGQTLTPTAIWEGTPKIGSQLQANYTVDFSFSNFNVNAQPGPGYMAPIPIQLVEHGHVGRTGRISPIMESYVTSWTFFQQIGVTVRYEIQREETYVATIAWNGQRTNRIQGPARSETINLEISMQDASGLRRWRPHRSWDKDDLTQYGGLAYAANKDFDGLDSFVEELNHTDPDNGNIADPLWRRVDTISDARGQSSFYSTPRGELAIKHQVLVAQARLAVSRASEGNDFTMVRTEIGLQVRCAMMMRVSSVPLGGDGVVVGKVSGYTLRVEEGGASSFEVRLLSVPGTGIDPATQPPPDGGDDGDGDALPDQISNAGYATGDPAGIYAPKKVDYPAQAPAWWPAGRSWPPNAQEDTFGVYTHSQGFRLEEGTSYLVQISPEVGLLPPLASNPYEGVSFPAQKPSWWPVVAGDSQFPGNGKDCFPWPPGTPVGFDAEFNKVPDVYASSDPFQFYKVPPESDYLDGTGGVRGEVFDGGDGGAGNDGEYNYVAASGEPWDKVAVRQTVIPYVPPVPIEYLAPPRYENDENGQLVLVPGGIEYKFLADRQMYALTHADDPHWQEILTGGTSDPLNPSEARDPIPGEPTFDPQKALDKMETEVIIHLVDVSGLSSSVRFEASGYWNGPKHVDLSGAQQ